MSRRCILLIGFNTQAYHFLELVAISGEYPAEQISLALGEGRYKEKVIAELKEHKLLKSYYKDQKRGYRVTKTGKRFLLDTNKERFSFYLEGNVDTNIRKSELIRRQRLHYIAIVFTMMHQAEITIFRDLKTDIFAPEYKARQPPNSNFSAFYNSREIKALGTPSVKIKNARGIGTLFAARKCFIVYYTGNFIMKWQYKSELRLKAVISYCMYRCGLQNAAVDKIQSIMIGDTMEMAYTLMTSTGGYHHNYFTLDSTFEHMYFIPANQQGITMLKILKQEEIKYEIYRILLVGLEANRLPGIPCHACTEDGKAVLFAFEFDMPAIIRFYRAVCIQKQEGVIICFDFQKDVIQRYCSKNVTLQTIDYIKLERRFFGE